MICPKCRTENPSPSKYCAECATKLNSSLGPTFTMTSESRGEELTRGLVFAGRYEIIEELGIGGMGRVFRAFDKKMEEEVALKLIKPEIAANPKIVERFRNEIKIARSITHTNVCRMHDLNEAGQTLYLTMEYVRGEDLKSLIRRTQRLAPGTAVSLGRQIAEGLAEAHKLGIVHRDLKPQNIMIDREGRAKIMDFGIARSLQTQGLTGENAMIGTPEYMSPEQVEGKDTDARSDIYALGVILFEMLTGNVPFESDSALGVALKQKTEPPPDPHAIDPRIAPELGRLVLLCLDKSKERRVQGAAELSAALAGMEEPRTPSGRGFPSPRPSTPVVVAAAAGKARPKGKLIAALMILAVFGTAAAILLTRKGPAPSAAPRKKRLVVLPFENVGPAEDEYFADGITDEIIARIASVSAVDVIARTSSIQYKKTTKPLPQIGKELDVDYVLSGSIRWQKPGAGQGRVRVVPSLTKASDSVQMWGDVYEEPIIEVFQVQSAISKKVIDALGIALREPEKKALENLPTRNMQAYDYYLRGNDLFYKSNNQGPTLQAIESYEQAVHLDPAFSEAFARLARAQAKYFFYFFDHTPERSARAKDAVDRASQLAPQAPETHIALGYYHMWCRLDFEKAMEHFGMSLEKQPQNADVIEGIAYIKRRQGRLVESLALTKTSMDLDPLSIVRPFQIGVTYLLLHDYPEAEKNLDRALALNPENVLAYFRKGTLSFYQGDTKKARRTLETGARTLRVPEPNFILYSLVLADIYEGQYDAALERLASEPSEAFSYMFYFAPQSLLRAQIYGLKKNAPSEKVQYESAAAFLEDKIRKEPEESRYFSSLGIAYAGLGRKADAVRAAEKAVQILPLTKDFMAAAFRQRDLAKVYTMVGEYDKAFDVIEKLLPLTGEISIPFLRLDPSFAPLLALPRFERLAKNAK